MTNRIALAASFILIGVLTPACYDRVTAPIAHESVSVAPDDVTLDAIGRAIRLSAVALEGPGTVVASPALYWSSSDPNVATVDETGTVTAGGEGDAVITVAFGEFAVATTAVHVRATIELGAQITSLLNPMVNPQDTVSARVIVRARVP